ncbi:24283_t:CDS:2, partial [Gigaspora rosea]
MSVRALVNLYENTDSPLVRNQFKNWFTVALIGPCIGMCMRTAQLGTDIKRTDALSLASSNRKYHNWPNNLKKFMGQKIDSIFTRLWRAGGSITIFYKDPQLFYLDNKFLQKEIIAFLKFLAAQIIKNNLDVLNSKGNNDIEPDENALYNELLSIPLPFLCL